MVRGVRRPPGDVNPDKKISPKMRVCVCVYLVCRTFLVGTGSPAGQRRQQPEIAGHEERQESSWESCDPEPETKGDDHSFLVIVNEKTLIWFYLKSPFNHTFYFLDIILAPPTANRSRG